MHHRLDMLTKSHLRYPSGDQASLTRQQPTLYGSGRKKPIGSLAPADFMAGRQKQIFTNATAASARRGTQQERQQREELSLSMGTPICPVGRLCPEDA